MLRSMTGYGAAVAETAAGRFTVELRSVNHRFSEVQIRTPRDLSTLEDRIRALVQSRIQRGRVEVAVGRDSQARRPRMMKADLDLAQEYVAATRTLAEALGVEGPVTLGMVVAFPDVIKMEETREDAEALWPDLEAGLAAALGGLVRMRDLEGTRLAADFMERAGRVAGLVDAIRDRSRHVVQDYAARLGQRLRELLGEIPVDEHRLAAELALMAERSDISEELTRLASHLTQVREVVQGGEGAVGRKLEFLLQEMGRETNTIGAKANDLDIARLVIAIKSELESLREQVQNIE